MSSQLCQNCYDVLSEYEEGKVMIIGREPVRLQPYGCIICATINMNFTKRSSPDVFRPRTLSKVLHVFDTISPNMCSFVTNGSTAGDTSFSRFAIMPLQSTSQTKHKLEHLLIFCRSYATLDTTHFSRHTIPRSHVVSEIEIEGMPRHTY